MFESFKKKNKYTTDENGWVKFDRNDSNTFPEKYDKYFIMRKDCKVHWETWNGTYWAYNGDVITHWKVIKLPKK